MILSSTETATLPITLTCELLIIGLRVEYLDSPSTTSSITYSTELAAGGFWCCMNPPHEQTVNHDIKLSKLPHNGDNPYGYIGA